METVETKNVGFDPRVKFATTVLHAIVRILGDDLVKCELKWKRFKDSNGDDIQFLPEFTIQRR